MLGEGALDQLSTGNRGAISQPQGDFFTVAVQDTVQRVERDDDVGCGARRRRTRAAKEIAQGIEWARGIERGVELREEGRGSGNPHGPGAIRAAKELHPFAGRRAARAEVAQALLGAAGDFRGGASQAA